MTARLRPGPRGPGKGSNASVFRFYAELNDFLPAGRRGREATYRFDGNPSVKDAIEAQGVPHTEVDLILVDGAPVGFDHHLQAGVRVAVYPVFESFDITPLVAWFLLQFLLGVILQFI